MNIRLKTSAEMETLLVELQSGLQMSSKAAVMRLAIGFSLLMSDDPRNTSSNYDTKVLDGQEYLRLTILGNDDGLYKLLMEQSLYSNLSDDDFFPQLVFAHIERGLKKLNSEFRYAKNKESFYKELIGLKGER